MIERDIDGVVQVVKDSTIDTYNRYEKRYYPIEAHKFDLSQNDRENYLKSLENKNNYSFVAEVNGKIVGMVRGIIIGKSGYSLLHFICVHPSKQRQGIGKMLLN